MGNRKQPFGYRMENGESRTEPKEAEIIRWIFQSYIGGTGYACIAAQLNIKALRYDADKPWNKNIIARILENGRYAGTDVYPAIVTEDELEIVKQIRAGKKVSCEVTPMRKVLRQFIGKRPDANMERIVLNLLNRLIEDPTLIQCSKVTEIPSEKALTLQDRLAELLQDQPVDEAEAASLVFQLASEQYRCIPDEEYVTERMRDILSGVKKAEELDAGLLREMISEISITEAGEIRIKLKNGQLIEGGSKA